MAPNTSGAAGKLASCSRREPMQFMRLAKTTLFGELCSLVNVNNLRRTSGVLAFLREGLHHVPDIMFTSGPHLQCCH